MSSNNSNEFVWDDKLVNEFITEFWTLAGKSSVSFKIDDFKRSKTPKREEFEILAIKEIGGYNQHYKLTGYDVNYIDFEKEYIFAVRRLSDGVEFKVGDEVEWDLNQLPGNRGEERFKIESFNINDILKPDRMFINNKNICIEYLSHAPLPLKKVLFTTEDGVDIFNGEDNVFVVFTDFSFDYEMIAEEVSPSQIANGKIFFTKKAAETWILVNKPVISINDMKVISWFMPMGDAKDVYGYTFRNLEQLAKSKIK